MPAARRRQTVERSGGAFQPIRRSATRPRPLQSALVRRCVSPVSGMCQAGVRTVSGVMSVRCQPGVSPVSARCQPDFSPVSVETRECRPVSLDLWDADLARGIESVGLECRSVKAYRSRRPFPRCMLPFEHS